MKKFWIKVTAFIIIFTLLFLAAQEVLHYHWPEDTYTRYLDYANTNPENTIDVFVFGTSEMYSAYSPITTYYQQGITGYNFSIQNRSAMTTYYQLKYALQYQTPKVVVCDFVCLFDTALPSESETVYRRTVDTMPDRKIRYELIREINKADPDTDFLSYYFPILRYHSIWNELTSANFEKDNVYNRNYPFYKKGANLVQDPNFDGNPLYITPELWEGESEKAEIAQYSAHYYELFINECQSRGIEVVCMLTPKVCDALVYKANFPTMEEWLSERGVKCYNYCTYEQIQRMGLKSDMVGEFTDPAHLNAIGSMKFSMVVADDLRRDFPNLPDRREDPACNTLWNQAWAEMTAPVQE